jgi:hypothetical protein
MLISDLDGASPRVNKHWSFEDCSSSITILEEIRDDLDNNRFNEILDPAYHGRDRTS